MTDDSTGILFQSFLQKALVSCSGMGRDVHSLMLSIYHFLCQPQHCSSSKAPRRMILMRLLCSVTCPNCARFHLLAVSRGSSCGSSRKLILLCTQSLVLWSKWEMWRSFQRQLVSKAWILFFFLSQHAGSMFQSHRGGWR